MTWKDYPDFYGDNKLRTPMHYTFLWRALEYMGRTSINMSYGRSWYSLNEKKFRDYMEWKLNTGR